MCLSQLDEARASFTRALEINRALDDRAAVATNLNNLARVAHYEGEHVRACLLQEESLAVRRALDDTWGQGLSTSDLADAVLGTGDWARVLQLQVEALAIWRSLASVWGVAYTLEGLVSIELAQSNVADAVRLAGAAAALREAIGEPTSPVRASRLETALAVARATLGGSVYDGCWSDGQAMGLEDAVRHATRARVPAAPPSPEAAVAPSAPIPDDPLSPREREVAELVARGLTNRQIAETLVISERTVDAHVARILSKLEFSTRTQVAAWVARRDAGVVVSLGRGQELRARADEWQRD